jgi:hypothetical protein
MSAPGTLRAAAARPCTSPVVTALKIRPRAPPRTDSTVARSPSGGHARRRTDPWAPPPRSLCLTAPLLSRTLGSGQRKWRLGFSRAHRRSGFVIHQSMRVTVRLRWTAHVVLGSIRPMWVDSLVAQGFTEACGTSSGLDNIFGSDRISSAGGTIVSFWAEFHLRNSLSFQLFSFPISVKSED